VARRSNILLVEDDLNDVILTRRAFQKTVAGLPIFVVPNGLEAVRYLKGEGNYADRLQYPLPDLVLMDLKMPVMNGFDAMKWIRRQPNFRRLPVIILTSSFLESDAAQAYESGANSFIIKPVDFNQLVESMQRLVDFWLGSARLPEQMV
jgi:CheY-like chemotaxis protein